MAIITWAQYRFGLLTLLMLSRSIPVIPPAEPRWLTALMGKRIGQIISIEPPNRISIIRRYRRRKYPSSPDFPMTRWVGVVNILGIHPQGVAGRGSTRRLRLARVLDQRKYSLETVSTNYRIRLGCGNGHTVLGWYILLNTVRRTIKRPISTLQIIMLVTNEVKKAETLYPASVWPEPVLFPLLLLLIVRWYQVLAVCYWKGRIE